MLRRQGNAPVLLWLLMTCVLAAVNGPRALLPTPEEELPGVRDNDEQVVFAMGQTPTSHTTCPSFRNSFQWQARGRDAVIARILAEHTGHLLLGCHIIPGNPHRISPAVFLLNATAHVYMEALYWDPALVYKVEYLYPHLQDDVGLAMRSPDSLTPTIYKAFSSSVWALTGISLLLFATMLKFVLQATCSQAALETAQIFLSGSFSSRRPRHMMVWGTLLSIVMLNSFSGVFTGFLTVPEMGPQMDTLQEVLDSVQKVYPTIDAFDEKVLLQSGDEVFLKLFDKVERYVNQWKEISSGYGAVLDSETSLERERLRLLVFAGVHLHTARQRVWAPAYKSFVAKRGWPLADRYSSLVQRLVDGGVVRLLADRANRALLRFHRQATAFFSPSAGPVKLSMRHFADAFVALACGLAAATAALAAEVARRPPAVRPRVARVLGRCYVALRDCGLAQV